MKHGGGRGGFTLVELMVVVSIIGLLMAIAVVVLNQRSPAADLREVSRLLVDELAGARTLAQESGNPVSVRIQRVNARATLEVFEHAAGGVIAEPFCNPVAGLTPVRTVIFDPDEEEESPRGASIAFVTPGIVDGDATGEVTGLCFLPNGRTTGFEYGLAVPTSAALGGRVGGRVYVEAAAYDCVGSGGCQPLAGLRTTWVVEQNGRVERMPAGYSVARAAEDGGAGDGDGDGD